METDSILDRIIRQTETTLKTPLNIDQKPTVLDHISPPFPDPADGDRPRSTRGYRHEVESIRQQLGDLEVIRKTLGLSRRKMCQLLLVDPSAWTRWTKIGNSPPPHIYRALQWYMHLNEKAPVPLHRFFLDREPRTLANKSEGSTISPISPHSPGIKWLLVGVIAWNLLLTLLLVWKIT